MTSARSRGLVGLHRDRGRAVARTRGPGESAMRVAALCGIVFLSVAPATAFADEAHAAIGYEKCAKTCHKVQLASWSESQHAKASPGVECETCHGNGADYKNLKVMKDPAQSAAAGLIARPDAASCAKCHEGEPMTAEAIAAVHAHKPKKK
jgi:hypothetical protein